ncbi:ATP-binding protein [Bizionia gelidisalsuginis]|uniref:ATP-binding protein n=2 Tax=Bizionia TaxID=283785 RepID=A0A8H2QF32_9FLAO|nr:MULTISPECIES: ATP-binding protein [Bizionia]TYB76795.1 ATP-binding protein [Bizionia saleffrena]TYC12027.1 ATP-binding protein [Bizionia gelidisalsuginis]
MNTKKIVIAGGPGTGKTAIINELIKRGYTCFEEVSREITLEARKQGIEQLFLTKPLLFSELLLHGRIKQFNTAKNSQKDVVFLDRGIPDIVAYMDYSGDIYPAFFTEACQEHEYDYIFILAPWQEIFISDSERYESFEQAKEIHDYLIKAYKNNSYELKDVPFGTINARTDYILNMLKNL